MCVNKRVMYERKISSTVFLQVLRRYFTLQRISEETNIPISLVSRYATGKVLPSDKHLHNIEQLYKKKSLIHHVLRDYLDTSIRGVSAYRLNTDPEAIVFVSLLLIKHLEEEGIQPDYIDYVMVPESGGIPLGVFFSYQTCSRLIIAKRRRNILWQKYVAGLGGSHDSLREYYIPLSEEYRGAKVMILDDITIDGGTIESLYDIAEKAGMKICCSYVVYALGARWRERVPEIRPLLTLNM